MNVAIVQCPAWVVNSPPYAISVLATALKKESHNVRCYDLNLQFYLSAKEFSGIPDNKQPRRKLRGIEKANAQGDRECAPKGRGIDPKMIKTWESSKIDNYWCTQNNVENAYKAGIELTDAFLDSLTQFQPAIVCFSVHYTTVIFSEILTSQIKTLLPDTCIIWGGPYCFNAFGNLNNIINNIPEIDVVCTGDGDKDLPMMLHYFSQNGYWPTVNGYYIRAYNKNGLPENIGDTVGNISEIPFGDHSCCGYHSDLWKFIPVIASKGCVNRCTFCNECKAYTKYQFRDPEIILQEILFQRKQYPEINTFWLTCSNIGGNLDKLKKLCTIFIEKKPRISWISQIAVHKNLNIDLFKLMKLSGCSFLYFGIESGNNNVLKLMNKGYNKTLATKILKATADAGIGFNFNLVVGFPGESIYNYIETLIFIKRFIKYGITPSVATCKILKNSRLYNSPEDYHIVNRYSPDWKTKDGNNTPKIRNFRKKYANQLYNSKIINLFYLSKNFFQFKRYHLPQNTRKWDKKGLGIIVGCYWIIFDVLSYFPFFLWLIYVYLRSMLLEISEAIISRKEDIFLPKKISIVKNNLLDNLQNFYKKDMANRYQDDKFIIKQTENLEFCINEVSDEWLQFDLLKKLNSIPVEKLAREIEQNSPEILLRKMEKMF